MANGSGSGLGALIAAKLVCCGGLVLVITGGLSLNAIGAWMLDGGLAWLALAAVLAATGVWLWRRRNRGVNPKSTGRSGEHARRRAL